MRSILMQLYGITAEQAAARTAVAWYFVLAQLGALLLWLDNNGEFDRLGWEVGRQLREVLDAVSDR